MDDSRGREPQETDESCKVVSQRTTYATGRHDGHRRGPHQKMFGPSGLIRPVAPHANSRATIRHAIDCAIDWSRSQQEGEGYWAGKLESNSCMEAQWVLAMHLLAIDDDPKYDRVVRDILNRQRADGSWEIYYDAPDGDINTTVECYAALRSAGFSPDDERLVGARRWIFKHGGLAQLRVFTRYWLAMIGEWPWDETPTMPPEIIRFPTWGPLHLYSFSSWARATIVPLGILSARRPVRPLPVDRRLDELFPEGRDQFDFRFQSDAKRFSIEWWFLQADRILSAYVRSPIQIGRESSIRHCIEWIIKHQDADGAWGGIQPPWIYSLLALHGEGYPLSHPTVRAGISAFNSHWSFDREDGTCLQASDSVVWDTVLTLNAMLDCGLDPREELSIRLAVHWLLDQQVNAPGDWQVTVKDIEPGGWAFERANRSYPDCDDTAEVIVALSRVRKFYGESFNPGDTAQRDIPAQEYRHVQTEPPAQEPVQQEIDCPIDLERVDQALHRAERWLRAMQCKDGGWAAFDRDNNNRLVTRIPFCDFGEVLDPSSVDVTAHVLEALAWRGADHADPAVVGGVRYILSEQESDASWFGRWGVNHVYGTGAVLPALAMFGLQQYEPTIMNSAARWLVTHQNPDGGWGETAASYMDESQRGRGPSTASQTAWAMIGLTSIGTRDYDGAIRSGLDYLIRNQRADGTWDEPEYTGTGFPGYGVGERRAMARDGVTLDQGVELQRGFMINYNMYRHYFPMMALGRAERHFM